MTTDEFAELIFNKGKREEFIKMAQELLGEVRDGGKKNNANNSPEADEAKEIIDGYLGGPAEEEVEF